MAKVDLDKILSVPQWEFIVKVSGIDYVTRAPFPSEMDQITALASADWATLRRTMAALIVQPMPDLANWNPAQLLAFISAYLHYLNDYLKRNKFDPEQIIQAVKNQMLN